MYRRRAAGWIKHIDFIILDMICLEASYNIAYCMRHGWSNPYKNPSYVALNLFMLLVYLATVLLSTNLSNTMYRGLWQEAKNCLKTAATLEVSTAMWLFAAKKSVEYSRIIVVLIGILFFFLSYVSHIVWKEVIRTRRGGRKADSMLVAACADRMNDVLTTLMRNSYGLPTIRGLIVLDGEPGTEIFGYPVVANQQTMTDYITHNWVDELLVAYGSSAPLEGYGAMNGELEQIAGSGVAVHKIICPVDNLNGRCQIIERMGGFEVLTDAIRIVSMRQAILKRCLDIAGGLVGCVLSALILLVVGPMIYIKSPGPIIFKQQRIGRNGKPFTMYKIRSMCMNADAMKQELAAANRVSDGMMFKVENDPRIIGSRIDADGVYHKGIGNRIRDYSLDEFPQFYNVLKGDMSLVGTRPPTPDEWEKYKPYHRARMTFRPGITGLWQISGRSDITDFDEVIKLDMQYISTWSAGQDFRIMLDTLLKVITKDGAL